MNHTPDRDDLSTFAWTQSSRVARREQARAIRELIETTRAWFRERLDAPTPVDGHHACR